MKQSFKILSVGCLVLALTGPLFLYAQSGSQEETAQQAGKKPANAADLVSTELIAANKNAIFDSRAQYTFIVKNASGTEQVGKVSYLVTTETGQPLKTDSVKVRIGKRSSGSYTFDIPESKPGFYKVNFMVNVTDYDDTTRKAFGIRPDEIRSPHPKPADFDTFWLIAKRELAAVAPDFRVTADPDKDTKTSNVYLIEMQSLGDITIRGWMTLPKNRSKHKKFAVFLDLPGYQVDLDPITSEDPDLALITLNVRGQGNSRGPIDTRHDEFIVRNIDDKNKYVMRGVIMDCIRCIDFICSRPELDHNKIFVKGGSMGAYLALITASLDKRVTLCSAQSPILGDIRSLPGKVEFPMKNIERYLQTQPGLGMEKIMDNLDYFDVKNFVPQITCNTIMSIGLVDNYAPPDNEYVIYNGLQAKKHIMVFKDMGHDASPVYIRFESEWMRDEFALF